MEVWARQCSDEPPLVVSRGLAQALKGRLAAAVAPSRLGQPEVGEKRPAYPMSTGCLNAWRSLFNPTYSLSSINTVTREK